MGFRKNTALALTGKGIEDRQFVRALARGLDILKTFQADDRGLSNAELAARTGFPKPTVSRLTFTLMSLGYLHMDETTGRYTLHPHILSLGFPVLRQLSIRDIARPLMEDLANACGGAVAMAVRDGFNMIVIERARHPAMTRVPLDIGIGRELATTAVGRAYLAGLSVPERAGLRTDLKAHYGRRWPAIGAQIEGALNHFTHHGFTVSAGDWAPDYNAVGVPLRMRDGTCLAFNCGGSNNLIAADVLPVLGVKLVAMVEDLARAQDLNPHGTYKGSTT